MNFKAYHLDNDLMPLYDLLVGVDKFKPEKTPDYERWFKISKSLPGPVVRRVIGWLPRFGKLRRDLRDGVYDAVLTTHPMEGENTAIRECREEAGIICQSLTPILQYHQGIDTTLSPAHIFKCTQFTVSDEFSNEETEERKWFPYAEAVEMAVDGRIEDSLTIIGLLAHDRIINHPIHS